MEAVLAESVPVPTEGGWSCIEVLFCRVPGLTRDTIPETLEPVDKDGHPTVPHQFRHPVILTPDETTTPAATFDTLVRRVQELSEGVRLAAVGDELTIRASHTVAILSAVP